MLEYLNNTKIIRQAAKKDYEFKTVTNKSLGDFQEQMMEHYRELVQYEIKYLGSNWLIRVSKHSSQMNRRRDMSLKC
jgi:hypothetical protein